MPEVAFVIGSHVSGHCQQKQRAIYIIGRSLLIALSVRYNVHVWLAEHLFGFTIATVIMRYRENAGYILMFFYSCFFSKVMAFILQ